MKADILATCDKLITAGNELAASYRFPNIQMSPEKHRHFEIATRAFIGKIAGERSEFFRVLPQAIGGRETQEKYTTALFLGSLMALRQAITDNFLESLESRLVANVHDDFLEQSATLIASRYYVAAMVLIGGVLEDHLKKLCVARALRWKGDGSLSKYNDLLKDNAYSQPVWRRIQAIGDVRNDAAHGNGDNVDPSDVDDALLYVRRCLADYPS